MRAWHRREERRRRRPHRPRASAKLSTTKNERQRFLVAVAAGEDATLAELEDQGLALAQLVQARARAAGRPNPGRRARSAPRARSA